MSDATASIDGSGPAPTPGSCDRWGKELLAILPWEDAERLTPEEALQSLCDNYTAGWQNYETGDVIRFQLEDVDFEEAELPLASLSGEAAAALEHLRASWPAVEVRVLRWSGHIERCGTLTREAVVVRRAESSHVCEWVLYLPGGEGDTSVDHTDGPMW
jgi:hypothetical protein